MLLAQHHLIALEVQRIEGSFGPGAPKPLTKWRWIAGRRYRVDS